MGEQGFCELAVLPVQRASRYLLLVKVCFLDRRLNLFVL